MPTWRCTPPSGAAATGPRCTRSSRPRRRSSYRTASRPPPYTRKNLEERCRNRGAPFEVQVENLERKEREMSSHSTVAAPVCTPAVRATRSLLGYGVLAGPLYVAVSLGQALTRPGFDLSRHAWSLLENGDLGWVQITNFVVTGLMTIAAAAGIRRAIGPGWAPRLIAAYGLSLV